MVETSTRRLEEPLAEREIQAWCDVAAALAWRTLVDVQAGDGDTAKTALLDLAFSPTVHHALTTLIDADVFHIFERITRRFPRYEPCIVPLFSGYEALMYLQTAPAPVLDLRAETERDGAVELLMLCDWYVPISPPLRPWQVEMMKRVQVLFPKVYVLGEWPCTTCF